MTWNLDDERALMADACLKDFYTFCDYAMGYGSNPDFKWWSKRVHRPFCDWFQLHANEWLAARGKEGLGWKQLMVVVMREFGKSMIITKAGLHWLHLRDPNISTYIGSSTVTRAQTFFEPIKVVLAGHDPNALFTWLYGNWEDPNRSWSSDQIVHAARVNVARSEPSVSVWGIETGITGTHPDVGIIDDPIDYDLMAKDAKWLEKVNSHIASLTPVFKRDALFIYVGTRYHNADAIGEALHNGGARSISGHFMPEVVARPEGLWDVYFMPGRDSAGAPIYPENWPETRLKGFEIQNPMIDAYLAALPDGREPRILASRTVFVTDDRQEALRFADMGLGRFRARLAKSGRATGHESLAELITALDVHLGTPAEVLASLQADSTLTRATDLTVQIHSIDPPHPFILRSIELMAEAVAPALGWVRNDKAAERRVA
jgi:hypothetical protein